MSAISAKSARSVTGQLITRPREWFRWRSRGFAAPAPQSVKWSILKRYGGECRNWIETGTYRADTTVWLSSWAERVISIEPQPDLFAAAAQRTQGIGNITIHHDESGYLLGQLLDDLDAPTGFWLDGHYSGGSTYRGDCDTPIVEELNLIGVWLGRGYRAVILVDDFRLFPNGRESKNGYPTRRWLVDWSMEHDLSWTIENDIFVAWSP